MKKEGEQGSIAKRWSRRTGRNVEGRIEFRGVRQVCPVGGKPGAQAKPAKRVDQRAIRRTGNGSREATGQPEALDGTGKALTMNGATGENGKRGPQGLQVSKDPEAT